MGSNPAGEMDGELLELQRQFESAQQAKSSVRLSDRNVVELVNKLQQLRFIDFDLLHTVSGKEYITPDQLRLEIAAEVARSGRVSLIDLSDIVGVGLYHVERQAQQIVADDAALRLIHGECWLSLWLGPGSAHVAQEEAQDPSYKASPCWAIHIKEGRPTITFITQAPPLPPEFKRP